MRLRRLVRRLTWQRKLDPELVAAVRRSGLFQPRWYLDRYPDVRGFPLGPLAHFCRHGIHERADPGPRFSTETYLLRAPEAARSDEPPFLHAMRRRSADTEYLWTPSTEAGLRPWIEASGLFDPTFYLEHNPDVARATSKPFEHYIRYGRLEDRAPGPDFDPEYYAERYPECRALFPTSIEHFVLYGRARGFEGRGAPLYQRWIALHDTLSPDDAAAIRAEAGRDPLPPVAFLHLVDAAAAALLPHLVDDLRAQIGSGWSARLVPAPALSPEDRRACETAADGADIRLAATFADALAALPDGATMLLCSGAVRLRPHAAHAFARRLAATGAAAAYADHDHLTGEARDAPVFKPAIAPEYLRRAPYPGPVAAFRIGPATRAALTEAAAEPASLLPSAALRRLDPATVARLPLILYHRTAGAPEPPLVPVADPPVAEPGAEPATVSIVIPTRDRVELLRPCIESILADTDYPAGRYEIIVVDNGSRKPETAAYFRDVESRGVRIVPAPGPFNFSGINNRGVAASTAEILVFLNNDTTVKRPDWLNALVAYARQPGIGAVGAQLLFPDDTVQHGGVVLGVHGVGIHRHGGVPVERIAGSDVTREMSAVTGACLAMRRALFLELGGFDPSFEVNFNDTKLCVQAVAAGLRNIYVAEPLLYHHESKSRGYNDSPAKQNRLYREAAALIAQAPRWFRDDPAYSPNLSLTRLDDPAFPPRIVRPWRRSRAARRVLFLSIVHGQGFGVPVVLQRQAEALRRRGFEVIVGGPKTERDTHYEGCRRVDLAEARAAANFAVSEGVDAIVAHTQPFYSVARLVGTLPAAYFVDHGEPDPELFPDRAGREAVNREKRLSAAFARRVFTISRTIQGQQFRTDAIVARNGSSHLAAWNADWAARREAVRVRFGFGDRFVILNVCRFTPSERHYKGVDRYVEIAQEFGLLHPELKERCLFVLVGRGEPEDVAFLEGEGLTVLANVTDEAMRELYAAADLYANFSRWEGYNLGIGQALAMGLKVVASDIEAHREFPIVTANGTIAVAAAIARAASEESERRAVVEPWETSLDLFCDTIEADLAAAPGPWDLS